MARVYASLDAESIHDRNDGDDFDWGILALADPEEKWGAAWSDLGEAIEQHGRDIDAYIAKVQAERAERPTYDERLAAFNVASHPDALREMQLEPAETEQPVEIVGTHWLPAMSLVLCFVLTVIWSVN